MKVYEADWQEAIKQLGDAMQQRERLDEQIESLHTRISALETLVQMNDRYKGKMIADQQTTPAEATVNIVKPQVTQAVKGLLSAATGPLTSAEILAGLKQVGWTLGKDGQPLALVFGVCRRLTDQKFAQKVDKGGKWAWVRTKQPQ
jgi:hypothetical protein